MGRILKDPWDLNCEHLMTQTQMHCPNPDSYQKGYGFVFLFRGDWHIWHVPAANEYLFWDVLNMISHSPMIHVVSWTCNASFFLSLLFWSLNVCKHFDLMASLWIRFLPTIPCNTCNPLSGCSLFVAMVLLELKPSRTTFSEQLPSPQ